MFAKFRQLLSDQSGSTMVEFAASAAGFFLLLFGSMELSNMYYQWNSATKAVEHGARLAAVSDPIPTGFVALSTPTNTQTPGDPMASYDILCVGAANSVNCNGTAGDMAALRVIVYGRDSAGLAATSCINTGPTNRRGMCMYFSRLRPENVSVRYQYTGLGYLGRPGGPVPTITVSVTNMTYSFLVLNGLLNIAPLSLPSFSTTVTGEDLSRLPPA